MMVMPAYFAPETRLMTLRGEVPAGDLRAGEMLLTLSGKGPPLKPLRQAGRAVLPHAPIRLRAGAVADGAPRRDLLLTPGQTIRPGRDGLAAVANLANGATVLRDGAVAEWVTLSLDTPDILLAEGLAVGLDWNPDPDPDPDPADRARLLARALALGWCETEDPGLMIEVDGRPLVPDSILPAGDGQIALRSRAVVPEEIDPTIPDARRLGVAVTALVYGGVSIPLDDPRLVAGFLPPEPGLRWTDGRGVLRLARPHPARLQVQCAPIWRRYWAAPQS